MENHNEYASQILTRISNSLVLLLEHIEPNTFEYDLAELLADYSHDKAKQISAVSATNQGELIVNEGDSTQRYA